MSYFRKAVSESLLIYMLQRVSAHKVIQSLGIFDNILKWLFLHMLLLFLCKFGIIALHIAPLKDKTSERARAFEREREIERTLLSPNQI